MVPQERPPSYDFKTTLLLVRNFVAFFDSSQVLSLQHTTPWCLLVWSAQSHNQTYPNTTSSIYNVIDYLRITLT